ncbi:MAG: hypothetical protein R3F34_03575 [Planctomycetota bacterium]
MEFLKNVLQRLRRLGVPALGTVVLGASLVACALQRTGGLEVHRWWAGLGPVVPHESFPEDCSLCHVGDTWNTLRADFEFDHEERTGVPLLGAHSAAQCLRCHNDRGPVQTFVQRGCAGCHEDVHQGHLGTNCSECHEQNTWRAVGQVERHSRTRFPLTGVHAVTSCQRCHPGVDSGRVAPTSTECVSCHLDNLNSAVVPDHFAFGWVNDCGRCHLPTTWQEAVGF